VTFGALLEERGQWRGARPRPRGGADQRATRIPCGIGRLARRFATSAGLAASSGGGSHRTARCTGPRWRSRARVSTCSSPNRTGSRPWIGNLTFGTGGGLWVGGDAWISDLHVTALRNSQGGLRTVSGTLSLHDNPLLSDVQMFAGRVAANDFGATSAGSPRPPMRHRYHRAAGCLRRRAEGDGRAA